MKKIILALLLGVLALTTSCEPQELVHSDAEISKIITILHDGMGQPASVCLEQLEEIGITLPLVKSEQTNDYVLQNSKMWLSVSEQNDSVIYARYELYTTNTYAEGINDFIDFDNVVYNQKWEKWEGGLDNDVTDLTQHDAVNKPTHYCSGKIETIDKIESVIDGLPAKKAAALSNVLKYFDRAGLKDNAEQDLSKANNYAFRLVTGKWRNESR